MQVSIPSLLDTLKACLALIADASRRGMHSQILNNRFPMVNINYIVKEIREERELTERSDAATKNFEQRSFISAFAVLQNLRESDANQQ